MQPQVIFFDVGFTLIYPARPVYQNIGEQLARMGHPFEPEQLRHVVLQADAAHWGDPRRHADTWHHEANVQLMWRSYYRRIFDQLALDDPEHTLADRIYATYQRAEAWAPFPEVAEALALLRASGYVIGAISDWGGALPQILHGMGLSKHIEMLLVSANLGIAKPHSELYRMALARAGVLPDQALMVGDTYYNDVLGARSVGMPGVLIDRHRRHPPLDCPIIHDLFDLIALLPHRAAA